MNTPQPGQHFILRRPYGGKDEPDKFYLVEVGSRKPRRPYSSENPADQVELIVHGECDELGSLFAAYGLPFRYFVAPGVVLDERYYTPVPQARKVAA